MPPPAPVPTHRLTVKTSAEAAVEPSRKRASEVPLTSLEEGEREIEGEDVHMGLVQALEEEFADLDVKDERQIRLENGIDWAPES